MMLHCRHLIFATFFFLGEFLRACPRVLIFDMDGVLVKCRSSWKALHVAFGSEDIVERLKGAERFIGGEISYVEWMRLDIDAMTRALGRPPSKDEVEHVLRSLELDEDAPTVVEELKRLGVLVGIVSGGIDILAKSVAERLGIPEDMVFANKLVFSDGRLTGGEEVVDPLRKGELLKRLSLSLGIPLEEFAYVGDSTWDINALRVVGTPIMLARDEDEARTAAGFVKNLIIIERLRDVVKVVKELCRAEHALG